jgi:hypothetical protein
VATCARSFSILLAFEPRGRSLQVLFAAVTTARFSAWCNGF